MREAFSTPANIATAVVSPVPMLDYRAGMPKVHDGPGGAGAGSAQTGAPPVS